jgi:hypothetical protein
MVSTSYLLALALSAFAAAQVSDSVPLPDNPLTKYLTMTDANGVITGMPAVVTSQPTQPAAVTSQPPIASLPALHDGTTTLTFNNHTYTVAVSGSVTSFVTSTSTTAKASGTGASASGSGAGASSTGAAATGRVAAGALVGAAGLFAAFL